MNHYITLLYKAPFILFFESPDYPLRLEKFTSTINSLNLSVNDVARTIKVLPNQDLRVIITETNKLEDPLAYNIIDALAQALLGETLDLPIKYLTSADWQTDINWQNVEDKPTPISHFTITVDKFTHRISIVDDTNTAIDEGDYDSIIPISGTANIPLPKALLNTCVVHIYENIIGKIKLRTFDSITQSKYVSVMQTGHDSFNWVNLKKLEKDLKAAIEAYGVIIEQ